MTENFQSATPKILFQDTISTPPQVVQFETRHDLQGSFRNESSKGSKENSLRCIIIARRRTD